MIGKSVRRVAYELSNPTTICEIMGNDLGMKKLSTRWGPKLLTPIQCANRVDCCHELLQESEENSNKSFDLMHSGSITGNLIKHRRCRYRRYWRH